MRVQMELDRSSAPIEFAATTTTTRTTRKADCEWNKCKEQLKRNSKLERLSVGCKSLISNKSRSEASARRIEPRARRRRGGGDGAPTESSDHDELQESRLQLGAEQRSRDDGEHQVAARRGCGHDDVGAGAPTSAASMPNAPDCRVDGGGRRQSPIGNGRPVAMQWLPHVCWLGALFVSLQAAGATSGGRSSPLSSARFDPISNGYSQLTFTFDPRLDRRVELLHFEHWLSIMQHTSSLMHEALAGRAHLASIQVLIPYKWRHYEWPLLQKPGAPIMSNRLIKYAHSDVIVGFEGEL